LRPLPVAVYGWPVHLVLIFCQCIGMVRRRLIVVIWGTLSIPRHVVMRWHVVRGEALVHGVTRVSALRWMRRHVVWPSVLALGMSLVHVLHVHVVSTSGTVVRLVSV